MPSEVFAESCDVIACGGQGKALLVARAATCPLANTGDRVKGDDLPVVEDRLDHHEWSLDGRLCEQASGLERGHPGRCEVTQFGGSGDAADAAGRGADRRLEEDGEVVPRGQLLRRPDDARRRLRDAEPGQGGEGGELVLYLPKRTERRHGGDDTCLAQPAGRMRQDRDLLLSGKQHVEPAAGVDAERGLEPAERIRPVNRDTVNTT